MFHKLPELAKLGFSDPVEFIDRITNSADNAIERWRPHRGNYYAQTTQEAMHLILKNCGFNLGDHLSESAIHEARATVLRKRSAIAERGNLPFSQEHDADFDLAEFCYASCRERKPEIVIETGVAYGVNSVFILAALLHNGKGQLISIDLPELVSGTKQHVGALVPDQFRSKWLLHFGTSKRVLPRVLSECGRVDMFVHDSMHTFRNMSREIELVLPYISSSGILIADDVQLNRAFQNHIQNNTFKFATVIQQTNKNALFGFGVT